MTFPSTQLNQDLQSLLPSLAADLKGWEGQNLLITGGTGFFGKWLLEMLHFARRSGTFQLGKIFVLSRNPEVFIQRYPHLQDFEFLEGDIRDFKFPQEKITGLIHGATSASAQLNAQFPEEMYEIILEGTRRALSCAQASPGCRFLMISSGAVYGKKTLNEGFSKEEEFDFHPQSKLNDAYADGKREAEKMAVISELGQSAVIARCFAFVGPYLPLQEHFAIGNFISNVLKGEEIVIQGDGSPRRTYLYPTELITGLFAVFTRGKRNLAYNIGSDAVVSIREVAEAVSRIGVALGLKEVPIKVLQAVSPGVSPPCYAPNIQRGRNELGLSPKINLDEAIRRTLKYHLEKKG